VRVLAPASSSSPSSPRGLGRDPARG
jgi:hypothetical protein